MFALQETDNWKVSEMTVRRGNSQLMSQSAVPDPSFVYERCTAVLIISMMVLSVYLPHSGYDEEDHITEWELIMEECKGWEQRIFHWR